MAKMIYTMVTAIMLSPWFLIRGLSFLVFVLNISPAIPLHFMFSKNWKQTKRAFRKEIKKHYDSMVADFN